MRAFAIIAAAAAFAVSCRAETPKLCKFEYNDNIRLKVVEDTIQNKLGEPPAYWDTRNPEIWQDKKRLDEQPELQKPGMDLTITLNMAPNTFDGGPIDITIDPCTLEVKHAVYVSAFAETIPCKPEWHAPPDVWCVKPDKEWPPQKDGN